MVWNRSLNHKIVSEANKDAIVIVQPRSQCRMQINAALWPNFTSHYALVANQ